MNLTTECLLVIEIFILTTTCSGQQPGKKTLIHFADEIMKVDSILSKSPGPAAIHLYQLKGCKNQSALNHEQGELKNMLYLSCDPENTSIKRKR